MSKYMAIVRTVSVIWYCLLTFRAGVETVVDVAVSDFVRLEPSDLRRYPPPRRTQERIRKSCDGVLYEFDRYCPHQGGDLSRRAIEEGVVVCPRHGWRFRLGEGGACSDNPTTINAIVVDEDG